MPPLSVDELAIAAQACRCLARDQLERAKAIENPTVRHPLQEAAERSMELAEKFERARKLKQQR